VGKHPFSEKQLSFQADVLISKGPGQTAPQELQETACAQLVVPVLLLLFFFFTLIGFTTSSWSKSSELITLNLCEEGWLPLPSSEAAWSPGGSSPELLSVELSELLLLRGSLATELATEDPRNLVSETAVPSGFSRHCTWTCSEHPDVSRPSLTEKEEFGFTTGHSRESRCTLTQFAGPKY
jgi:hypothetical protein